MGGKELRGEERRKEDSLRPDRDLTRGWSRPTIATLGVSQGEKIRVANRGKAGLGLSRPVFRPGVPESRGGAKIG